MTIAKFQHVSEVQYAQDTREIVKKLPLEQIPLPVRATAGSAGYDFVSTMPVELEPGKSVTVPTGIRVSMQPGWVLMIFPRSSLGFKHNTMLANTVGIIDSDYFFAANEGHVMIRISNHGDHVVCLTAGERFCQGIFVPYGLAEEEKITAERIGGFGSTGAQ